MVDGRWSKNERCLSPLVVDELLRSEKWDVPAPEGASAHAAACPACAARLEEARELEDRFRERVLPRSMPALVEAHRKPSPWIGGWTLAGATAAATIALALVLPGLFGDDTSPVPPPSPQTKGYVGIKSAAGLGVYVKRGEDSFPLKPGGALHPGDRIRLMPMSAEHRYLLVIYVDARGEVQVVYPWGASRSGPLPETGELLEDALLLDETLGTIQIVGLFSHEPLDAKPAVDRLLEREGGLASTDSVSGQKAEVVVLHLQKRGK